MPTVEISKKELEELVGREMSMDELEDVLLFVKGELEDVDGDVIKVDIKDTNRPDLWSVEGIAREIRGHLRIEKGLPKYEVRKSDVQVFVDKELKNIRPAIACAIIKNVHLSDAIIRQMMQLQEKIHMTFGRRREYVAIGISNLDLIEPPVYYKAIEPDGISFPPLGFTKNMTPAEILEKHPKGKEYGGLIKKFGKYPILVDSKNDVISMPPVINSNTIGKIDENTTNLFIDVTGLRYEDVLTALNVVVTALADRGGEIYSVRVIEGKKVLHTPDLNPKEIEVDGNKIRDILGLEISDEEIIRLLKEARYDAEIKENKIIARYLPTRDDILHWRDVAEDVAISFGYNDFLPEEPKIASHGSQNVMEQFCDKIRELAIGYGLQEVMTFTLTNKEVLFSKMERKEEPVVEIANPVSSNWTTIRCSILPCLMEFLSKNKHVEYPQNIFEVGDVVVLDDSQDTKTKTKKHLAIALASADSSFTAIKEIVESMARRLNLSFEYTPHEDGAFIKGRCAGIRIKGKKHVLGVVGEINPKVLNNWEIEMPVAAAEIELDGLVEELIKD